MNRRGFTLIEVLISASLVVVMGATVVGLIMGGLRVWQRTDTLGTREAWVQVAFDQWRRELRSMAHFKPIPFTGAYDSCAFASTHNDTLGATRYYFDSPRQRLCRTQQPYPQWRARRETSCSALLQDVQQVRFSYYAPRTETGGGTWAGAWAASDAPPQAVKLTVTYRPAGARDPVTYESLVYLPGQPRIEEPS